MEDRLVILITNAMKVYRLDTGQQNSSKYGINWSLHSK